MTNKFRKLVCYLVPVAALALAALPAAAQRYSDAVYLIDPQGGVTSLVLQEDQEQPGVFIVLGVPGDPTQLGNPTAMVEVSGKGSMISDIFGVVMDPTGAVSCAFGSDPDDGSDAVFPDPPTIFIDEPPDGLVDVTMYLDPFLQADGFLLIFISDTGHGG
jgi:hypothetical protein